MHLNCLVEQSCDTEPEFVRRLVQVPSSVSVNRLLAYLLKQLAIRSEEDKCEISLQLPNWKPMRLSDICQHPDKESVVSLLMPISGVAIVKLRLPPLDSSALSCDSVRRLLRSLVPRHTTDACTHVAWLRQAGCPLPERSLHAFVNSPDCHSFAPWERQSVTSWHSLVRQQCRLLQDDDSLDADDADGDFGDGDDADDGEDSAATLRSSVTALGRLCRVDIPADFDAATELPLLRKWYATNPNPTRHELCQFRDTLNRLSERRRRQPLKLSSLHCWFAGVTQPQEAALLQLPTPPSGGDSEMGDDSGRVVADAGKRRRTRVFLDPSTELPQLERWFSQESHPTAKQFQEFAQTLNSMPFRQHQSKLQARNVQLWFKNRRAKVKRGECPRPIRVNAVLLPAPPKPTPLTPPADSCEGGLTLPLSPADSEVDGGASEMLGVAQLA